MVRITQRGRRARAAAAVLLCVAVIYYGGESWGDDRDRPPPVGNLDRGDAPGRPAQADRALFRGRLLVYGIHGLTAAEVAKVAAAVSGPVTGVYGGQVFAAGGVAGYPDVPQQAFTADPVSYSAAVGLPGLARQMAAGLVLSTSGALLRQAAVGNTLTMSDGRVLHVSAVVEDHVLGGYEMATSAAILGGPAGPLASYLLVGDGGEASRTEGVIRRALPDRRLRIKQGGSNGFMSSIDTVLTQAQIKLRFGEFAMRGTAYDASFTPDPAWRARWIMTTRVPQLGLVACNKAILGDLVGAMREVTADGLGKTVHTADFARAGGCYSPRATRFSRGVALSAHSWGIAVDINVDANPLGAKPQQDARLVAIMERHGFLWGGRFLRPDGAHFEWVGPQTAGLSQGK